MPTFVQVAPALTTLKAGDVKNMSEIEIKK